MCSVESEIGVDLGQRLRSRRTAAGRTVASVAMEAGLSVPYVANLENARGNPTIGALASLASALGGRLRVELTDDYGHGGAASPVDLPENLVRFARQPRFVEEAGRLADDLGEPPVVVRERLLAAMAGLGAVVGHPLAELDWHRILDVVVLIGRG